eukprot:7660679-Pyramimonas_sp.AAC.3
MSNLPQAHARIQYGRVRSAPLAKPYTGVTRRHVIAQKKKTARSSIRQLISLSSHARALLRYSVSTSTTYDSIL